MAAYLFDEVVNNIQVMDTGRLLSPELIQTILSEVMRAVDDHLEHRDRVAAERRVTGGVRDEQEGEA